MKNSNSPRGPLPSTMAFTATPAVATDSMPRSAPPQITQSSYEPPQPVSGPMPNLSSLDEPAATAPSVPLAHTSPPISTRQTASALTHRSPSRASFKVDSRLDNPNSVAIDAQPQVQPSNSRPSPNIAPNPPLSSAPPNLPPPQVPPNRHHMRLVSDPMPISRQGSTHQEDVEPVEPVGIVQDSPAGDPGLRRRTSIAPSIAPSITPSVTSLMPSSRAPSAPPGSSQVSLERKKTGIISRFFRPKAPKEPKPENPLYRITSHDSAPRNRLMRNRPTTPAEAKVVGTSSRVTPGNKSTGFAHPTTPPAASSPAAQPTSSPAQPTTSPVVVNTTPQPTTPPAYTGRTAQPPLSAPTQPPISTPAQSTAPPQMHSTRYQATPTQSAAVAAGPPMATRAPEPPAPTASPKHTPRHEHTSGATASSRHISSSQRAAYLPSNNPPIVQQSESPQSRPVVTTPPAQPSSSSRMYSEATRRGPQDEQRAKGSRPPAQDVSQSSSTMPTGSTQSSRAPPPTMGPRTRSDPPPRDRSSTRRPAQNPARLKIPANSGPSGERKSPIKSAFTSRWLSQRRHRTVSAASIEAVDGTSVRISYGKPCPVVS